MNANDSDGQLHSVRLKVLGLTGIAVDEDADTVPKQMRAVVAATRDSDSYGFSGPSRRLVKAPRNEQFIAIWTSNHPNIEFETAIEPQLRRSLHRNFELVIGITSSRSVQPIPIGAASLPLQQAVALRSRDTDKIVLDLPVFNLASLKENPFQTASQKANEISSSSISPQKTGGLFRSRSLSIRHHRSGATTGSASVATLSPSWKSPGEAVVPQAPCPYKMDPGRDAAILRIELEVKELVNETTSAPNCSNFVLVQSHDNSMAVEHSVEVGLSEPNSQLTQYRVKIVDETTMDCELARVNQKASPEPSQDYSPTPTLASTSGEMSSVEHNLYVWPSGAVERVFSDNDGKETDKPPGSEINKKVKKDDDTKLTNRSEGIELIGGVVESISRKPSFFRRLPRIRSKSAPHSSAQVAVENSLRTKNPQQKGKQVSLEHSPLLNTTSDINTMANAEDRATALPSNEKIPHRLTADPLHHHNSSKLPTVGEGQTSAPETFEATPVHFAPKRLSDNIQFTLAMNMMNAAPPPVKKQTKKKSIPMGTILHAPKQDTAVENLEQDNKASGFASSLQNHFKGMFMSNEEEQDEPSMDDEETEMESYRRPAIRDDIVDLVAVFGDMCRQMNTSALDESLTEAHTWLDNDENDMTLEDEDDVSVSEDGSNDSNDLFSDMHSGQGTEVDVSKAVPLRSNSRLFSRKRSVRENQIQLTTTESIPDPQIVSTPPKKLVSVLRNGAKTSPQRVLPKIDELNNGSQPPHPAHSSPLNPLSLAQHFVEYVTKAMTPAAPEETFPVPSVFLEARDTASVGDLTATSHEIQIDMQDFKKLIEEHMEQARERRTEYVDGDIDMFRTTDDENSCPTTEDQIIPKTDTASWEDF